MDEKAETSVEDLAKEKERLQNDITLLRAEYDAEVGSLKWFSPLCLLI